MASKQVTFTEISPSEFFYRNRDLAGFSNPARALYSAIRELVENSLDACELFKALPEVVVQIGPLDGQAEAPDPKPYRVIVQDNGPGVEPKFVPNAFGRVFFGSKFRLRQARGMFGMGGTMAILYGQITTNRPVIITSSTDGQSAHAFEMMIDIQNNTPMILRKQSQPTNGQTGITVQLTLEGDYFRAAPKIQDYLKQTAMVTPYANLTLTDPQGRTQSYRRGTEVMPAPPVETLPHPYGIDAEALRRLLKQSRDETLVKFMYKNFHRVGDRIASKFLVFANLDPDRAPRSLTNEETVLMAEALHRFDEFLQPDASCLSPLGEELLKTGVAKELQPEFVATVIRPASAYSGYPFIVEVALAYGGRVLAPGIKLFRFANRIPLLYDEASDVAWKVLNEEIDWKRYKIPQDAPLAVITHVCSTKVPYKTVGKEYLADRPELERELKNAVRETLRKLSQYVTKKGSIEMVKRKLNIYGKYLPLVARFSTDLARATRAPRFRRLLGEEPAPETEKVVVREQKVSEKEGERDEDQKTLEDFA